MAWSDPPDKGDWLLGAAVTVAMLIAIIGFVFNVHF